MAADPELYPSFYPPDAPLDESTADAMLPSVETRSSDVSLMPGVIVQWLPHEETDDELAPHINMMRWKHDCLARFGLLPSRTEDSSPDNEQPDQTSRSTQSYSKGAVNELWADYNRAKAEYTTILIGRSATELAEM